MNLKRVYRVIGGTSTVRVLKLNALCGVKNQMYSAEQYVGTPKGPYIRDGFFDINSLFWSCIFDSEQRTFNFNTRTVEVPPITLYTLLRFVSSKDNWVLSLLHFGISYHSSSKYAMVIF